MASKIEKGIELKTGAEKVWNSLKQFATVFPEALPQTYEKIQVVEGDGSAGSIVISIFKGESHFLKKRIDLVDDQKKILIYTFLEGKILDHYKNFKAIVCVMSSKSDGNGSLVNYTAEFEKKNAQVPNPDFFIDVVVKIFHDLDGYLLSRHEHEHDHDQD